MANWLLLMSCLALMFNAAGQRIEKIPTTLLNGPDGMVVDKDGNIFIANWGQDGKGKTVVKIDRSGKESVFANDLASPDGITIDTKGDFYISCFASGEIVRIDKKW